jgi:phosphohistidine phosphatase
MTNPRRLVVMRHAKAEPFAATDHDRRLTDRGRQDASDVGRHLREAGLLPDLAVVSTAVRTRETWSEVERASGADCPVSFAEALFTGSADVVLDAVRGVAEAAACVLVVGHNPTAADLCHLLDDGNGDPEAVSGLLRGFPPAAITVFDVGVPWAELAAETGRVVGYYVGRS